MYLLWMVVMLLLFVQRNISIIVNYIRNAESDSEKLIDRGYDDEIAKYNNSSTHDHKDIDYDPGYQKINESKGKSVRQDMFMLKESDRFKVSYPSIEYHFHKSMLNKGLCDRYTLECIYYRSDYPRSRLSFDGKTGKRYNPCLRFVEPCFGISEHDYRVIKKFRSLKDY